MTFNLKLMVNFHEMVLFNRFFYYNIPSEILCMWVSCTKGVEQFRQALEISPQSVSAQYGLASGLLGLAKECVNLGAFRWGASLLEVSSL